MADLKTLKGVGEKDRKLIEDAEALIGPEPTSMGFVNCSIASIIICAKSIPPSR